MKKKNTILYFFLGILIIVLLGVVSYNYYQKNNDIILNELSVFLEEFKDNISTYELFDQENEYLDLVTNFEQTLINEDKKSLNELQEKMISLKENLLTKNIEMTDEKISCLENTDISKLEDSNSVIYTIEEIKKLKENHNFIKINTMYDSILSEINIKLAEVLSVESEKNIEELLKNIDGYYEYNNVNKNGLSFDTIDMIAVSSNNKLSISGGYSYIVNIDYGNIDISEATDDDLGKANIRFGSFSGELELIDTLTWKGYLWDDRESFHTSKNYYNDFPVPDIEIEIKISDDGSINTMITDPCHLNGNKIFTKAIYELEEFTVNNIQSSKKELESQPNISIRNAYDLVNQHGLPVSYYGYEYESLNIYDSEINSLTWELPDEGYYLFVYDYPAYYLVGKESGLVYSHSTQPAQPAYLMKNGQIEKTYEWTGPPYE